MSGEVKDAEVKAAVLARARVLQRSNHPFTDAAGHDLRRCGIRCEDADSFYRFHLGETLGRHGGRSGCVDVDRVASSRGGRGANLRNARPAWPSPAHQSG